MMDYQPSHFVATLFLLIIPSLLLLKAIKKILFDKKSHRIPPSPPQLPFIGNLHQIGSSPHSSLATLSNKYGPLMMLKLGEVPTLVASSPEMVKDILRTYDQNFASRPPVKPANILLYECNDIAFAPYGKHWRQMRKLSSMHLFNIKIMKAFQQAREEEVAFMVDKIAGLSASAKDSLVDMSKVLNEYSIDIICRAVSGKSFREGNLNEVFLELIEGNFALLSEFYVEDYFPSLSWLDRVIGPTRRAKKQWKRWDVLLDNLIKDHVEKTNKEVDDVVNGEQERDFVDVMLSVQDETTGGVELPKGHIKAVLVDMFAAGTDTTYVTLEWAMAELAKNPKIMKKLQDEVRSIASKQQSLVKEEQLTKMEYLKAVIKETLRLHPPVPLLLPHESVEDCEVQGYQIPKKTKVIVNAWAVGRDANYWESAEEFNPERFMNDENVELEFKGNHFQFIPFGSGRRICPGLQFANYNLELALANLVHHFDWELPNGFKCEDMEMVEAPGLTIRRKQRLELVARTWVQKE